jgi:uncharacterized protein (TIGR02147 family)
MENSDCSASLVSQVLKGKRSLTRERVESFVRIFGLSRKEASYLDRWVALERTPFTKKSSTNIGIRPNVFKHRQAQNHLLNSWLNVYVKDACTLKEFDGDLLKLHRLLGGIATRQQIEKSLKFLLSEGFLRRTMNGCLVENTQLVTTSDDIPSVKIQRFHKRALDIAKKAIDLFPIQRRRANAVILPLDDEGFTELNEILKEFYERLLEFSVRRPKQNKYLYQVLLHLSPIGGFDGKSKE